VDLPFSPSPSQVPPLPFWLGGKKAVGASGSHTSQGFVVAGTQAGASHSKSGVEGVTGLPGDQASSGNGAQRPGPLLV
jgi:hypothetical protein